MTYPLKLHNALSIAVIAAEFLAALWLVTTPAQFLWAVEILK